MLKRTHLQQTDSETLNVNIIMSVTQIRKCASKAYHCHLIYFDRKHCCHEETHLLTSIIACMFPYTHVVININKEMLEFIQRSATWKRLWDL